MATETEVVKTRFGAHPKVCPAAAMTTDARIGASAIDEVVVTLNAVHLPVPVVRKAQDQWFTTPHKWLTQGECRAATQQQKQRTDGAKDDCEHEPRMPSEDECANRARGRLRHRSPGARTQQREQHDSGQQNVRHNVRATFDVTTRRDDVDRQCDHQQARSAHVCRLEGAVTRPEPRTDRSAGRHGKEEKREDPQHSRIFVAGRRQLYVLDNAVIDPQR